MSESNDIEIFSGEDIVMTFTESSTADITGWTIELEVTLPDGSLFTKAGVVTVPASAQYQVSLTRAETLQLAGYLDGGSGPLPYQVRRTDSGSNAVLSDGALTVK
jgi:hypothetical protein